VTLPLRAEVNTKGADVQTVSNDRDGNGHNVPRDTDDETELKGTKILLVEDNAVNLKLVKTFLDKLACETDIATDGQEAIEKVKEGKYNIVLMDIQMPVMNGLEATEIIRRDIDKDVPIVALTAAAMEGDREKSISSGMNDYLTKPVSFDSLKDMLLKRAAPLKP
jgi:CheY-like chemotaxis protein